MALLPVTLLVLFACRPSAPPAPDESFLISVPYDLQTLDPHSKNNLSHFAVASNFYESLVTTDPTMRIVPSLAKLWENPDHQTWIFHLQEGVHFHSGKPLTSADVVYSFRRLLEEKDLEVSGYLQGVAEVNALSSMSVLVRTYRPSMVFLNKVRFVLIVPEGSTVRDLQDRVDGTGPYRLVRWTPKEDVEMARNESYWGRKPDLNRVSLHLRRFPEQAIQDARDGRFHIVQCNSRKVEGVLASNHRYEMLRSDSLFLKFLSYDLFRDRTPYSSAQPNPFRNKLVRQALNLGIDRRRLVNELSTYAVPASQLVPPFIFGYNRQISLPEYNPSRARELLQEAGLGRNWTFTLHARQLFAEAGALIREQLKEIGIQVDLQVLPDQELLDILNRRQATAFLSRMGCTTGDISDILDNTLHSVDKEKNFGWHNYSGYANPELDRLIEQSNEIPQIEHRKSMLLKIVQMSVDDLIWIPLYIDQDVYAVDRGLRWHPRNDSFLIVSEIARAKR